MFFHAIYSAQTTKIHFKSHCLSRNALLKKANIIGTPLLGTRRKQHHVVAPKTAFHADVLIGHKSLIFFRPKDRFALSSAYFNFTRKAIGICTMWNHLLLFLRTNINYKSPRKQRKQLYLIPTSSNRSNEKFFYTQ